MRAKSNHDFDTSQREVQEIRANWSVPEAVDQEVAERAKFDKLKTSIPNLVAWLKITDVDYPVVQGEDNEFYLNHDYAGNYNPLGAVFLEMENTPDFTDQNSIIYGHNVRSGKVFHSLTAYLDPGFVAQAPVIELLTASGMEIYEIRGIYDADPYDNFRSPHYEGEKWERFTHRWEEKNILKLPVPTSEEKLLTLQTCLDGDRRLVIHGVKIQK